MKKLIYIPLTVLIILLFSSCGKELTDLANPNKNTVGSFWETEDDFIRGTNAVYQALLFDGCFRRVNVWRLDVHADDVTSTTPWWIRGVSQYIYEAPADNPVFRAAWEHNYIGIWRANQLISNLEPFDGLDNDLKERLLGEAYFLRGLFYYYLLVNHKEIILVLPENMDEFYQPLSERDVAWDQVISDFSKAIEKLPTKEEYSTADLGRATKGAAAGFLAKTYMILHRYSDAETLLNTLANTDDYGSYDLVSNYRDNFTEFTENNKESLFEVQFDIEAGGTNEPGSWGTEPAADWAKTNARIKGYAPVPYGWGDVCPTDWIYEEFLKERTVDNSLDPRLIASMWFGDPTDEVYIYTDTVRLADLSLAYAVERDCTIFIRKYLSDETNDSDGENSWLCGTNERILRFADILLLYGECLNELGRTSEAAVSIQRVRDRANLPNLATAKPIVTTNQDSMRYQIYHERALELCFEGQRLIDLIRWGCFENVDLDISQMVNPELWEMILEHDPEYKLYQAGHEFLAIPVAEVNANYLIEQDPAYQ
ncbi:MAG: RagB/SusD family nutrient uptake outer membrane protein [Bacteroidales bacterium]|nr:RagB/SusD family nutrient uptake outer membrane protein [Bacteroidales bacterium]